MPRSKTSTKLLAIRGKRTVDSFHRELGKIMWDDCGMSRNAAGLKEAIGKIRALREEFWQNVNVPGIGDDLNQSLEKAGRVADFLELAELMCIDALERNESCGGHFREEYQTPDGEAQRDDEHFQLRRSVGLHRRGQTAGADQRAAGVCTTFIPARGATSNETQADTSGGRRTPTARGNSSPIPWTS